MPRIPTQMIQDDMDLDDKSYKYVNKPKTNPRIKAMIDEAYLEDVNDDPYEKTQDSHRIFKLMDRIPMKYWSTGWVFREIDDHDWHTLTIDSEERFPECFRKNHFGHPAYILDEIGDYNIVLCPLSTSKRNLGCQYIPEKAILEQTGYGWEMRSYVVCRASTRIRRDDRNLQRLPRFLGVFPSHKLER